LFPEIGSGPSFEINLVNGLCLDCRDETKWNDYYYEQEQAFADIHLVLLVSLLPTGLRYLRETPLMRKSLAARTKNIGPSVGLDDLMISTTYAG